MRVILLAAIVGVALTGERQLAAEQAATTGAVTPPPAMPGVDPKRMEFLINTTPDTTGTGPYPALKEEDPSLPDHVIYRPANLGRLRTKLGIVVWGNGGCLPDGAFARFQLTQIASYGYLVIANGRILSGPGKPPLHLDAPPPGAPPGPPAPGASPPPPATTPAQMVQAIDWAIRENARPGSPYRGKIDTGAIAASGGSCGGLQALQVATSDPRVRTAVIFNSGIFDPPRPLPGITIDKAALDRLRGPILYILGGPTDIAYPQGMDDFRRITKVPAAVANQLGRGHGGSAFDPNGGKGATTAVAWLDWQFRRDPKAARMFVGKDCGLCRDPEFSFEKKNID